MISRESEAASSKEIFQQKGQGKWVKLPSFLEIINAEKKKKSEIKDLCSLNNIKYLEVKCTVALMFLLRNVTFAS